MEETLINLEPSRFEGMRTLLIAGLKESYNIETSSDIPAQWQHFGPYIGKIPGQVCRTAYGVRCNGDDAGNIDYICGVEVSDFSLLPADLSRLRIPGQRYAVFSHRGHISRIRSTWHTIFDKWLPTSGYEVVDAPDFERYGEDFDPRTGTGIVEIWIPIKQ